MQNLKKTLSDKKIIFITVFLVFFIPILMFFLSISIKNKDIAINISPTPQSVVNPNPILTDIVATRVITPVFVQNELIVKYKKGSGPDEITKTRKKEIDKFLEDLGVISSEKLYKTESSILKNYYLLKLKQGVDVLTVVEKIKTLQEVEHAEPNFIYKTQ